MNRAAFAIHHNKIKTAPAPTETVYISEDMQSEAKNIVSSSEQSRKRNVSSHVDCYFCTFFSIQLHRSVIQCLILSTHESQEKTPNWKR